HLNQIRMYYSGKDYCVDLDLKSVIDGNALELKEAWKSFNLFNSRISSLKSIDLAIGKITYPFGNVSSKASKNISLLQPVTFGTDFMMKLNGNICDSHTLIVYMADPGAPPLYASDGGMHFGLRGTTNFIKGIDLGVSIRMQNLISDTFDALYDWGFDIRYTLMGMIKLDLQGFNLDDGDDNTDDLDVWFLATYLPGFNIPILKKITPYGGYFSKSGMEDYNIIVGINFAPVENTFFKLEYNLDSLDEGDPGFEQTGLSDSIGLQVGFLF
ncbi:MAG: hypothetical protein KAW87_07565, partial [Candidatus Cloacimonetes bacterium]|nr:hypothetical protein [Candidatus Cloacimonadota bacterium]